MHGGWRPLASRHASLLKLLVGFQEQPMSKVLDGIVSAESRRLSSGQDGQGRGANAVASGPNGPSDAQEASGLEEGRPRGAGGVVELNGGRRQLAGARRPGSADLW